MLTAKHISNILNMCNNECVIIDVSTCREATITRIHNTLLESTQFGTSTIKKINQNGKCLLMKNTTPSSKTIHLFRRHDSCIVYLQDDGSVEDFVETYLVNYDEF